VALYIKRSESLFRGQRKLPALTIWHMSSKDLLSVFNHRQIRVNYEISPQLGEVVKDLPKHPKCDIFPP
jgi:hypothetical protein